MGLNGGLEGGDAQRPLLIRIDADDTGSVGSTDTESEASGDEGADVAGRIGEAIRTVNQGFLPPGRRGADRDASPDADADLEAAQLEDAGAEEPLPGAAAKPAPASGAEEVGGLAAGKDCSVCMVRQVQVVLVPCGHICLCRRCSRRLQRCPMCRKEIARRQRLFI